MAWKKNTYEAEKEIIRRTTIVVALVLFMYATSIDSPKILVKSAGSMLGSAVIGVYAGVDPNPDNTVAAQLAAKQQELDAREASIAANSGGSLTGTRSLAAAAFVTSILVLLLVAANYYMDWRRYRRVA